MEQKPTYSELIERVRDLERESGEKIARLQQARNLLEESEARYRSVFENSGTATVIIEEDGTISMANTEFEKLSGYTKPEIEGNMKWTTMVHPEDLEWMTTYFAARRKAGSSPPAEYEFRLVDRHGRQRHIHVKNGMIPGTARQVSSLTDITRLRETERLFRDLFINAQVGLYILQGGRFQMINRQLALMTGYEEKDLLGMRSLELVHPEYREAVKKWSVQMLHGQRSSPYEFVALNKQGSPRWILETVTPIVYQGNRAVLGNFVDITRNKEMEEELVRSQKIESIGTLAGGIAHDFNNLLTAILGYVELSQAYAQEGSKSHGNLEKARKACLRARDLTRRFITFSRGGAPKMMRGPIDPTLITAVTLNLSGTPATPQFSIDSNLWEVQFDEAQIQDVIGIVIRNSLEAMPKGGKVSVSARNVMVEREAWGVHFPDAGGPYVHMVIQDQGAGIPRENLGKLFDPYFSTKPRGEKKGMGLGLSTAYSIIRRHHGHIAIDSSPGTGANVHIYLPASGTSVRAGKENIPSQEPLVKQRVLVMDDEEMLREVAAQMLSILGYEVACAREGQEAIDLFEKALHAGSPFDAVILDLTVKNGMGGEEALCGLRNMDPQVTAVVSSGHASDPIMTDPQHHGFQAAIQKPYGLERLREEMARALESRRKGLSSPPAAV